MTMHGDPDGKERQAIAVVEFLRSIGEIKRANDVASLIRSAKAARATASVLARDVKALRQGGVWCTFCEGTVKHREAAGCKRATCPARPQAVVLDVAA